MMSASTIHAMSQEAAAEACRAKLKPFPVWPEDLLGWQRAVEAGTLPRLPFPFLGDYIPEGYEVVDEFFVDASGWGQEGEPALTIAQFIEKVEVNTSYAIFEAGQFQVYIRAFKRIRLDPEPN